MHEGFEEMCVIYQPRPIELYYLPTEISNVIILFIIFIALLFCRKYILEPHNIEDPSYEPLPEDSPGGYAWGQPHDAPAEQGAGDNEQPEQNQ